MFAKLKIQREKIRENVYNVNLPESIKSSRSKYSVVLLHKCIMVQTMHRTLVSFKKSTSEAHFTQGLSGYKGYSKISPISMALFISYHEQVFFVIE